MAFLLKILFWSSVLLLVYSYLGYGVLLWVRNRIRTVFARKPMLETPGASVLPVTLVVAAYNEAPVLEDKIRNSLALEYPSGSLEFIFITDGSTDHSNSILDQYPQILHLHEPERKGKTAAVNRAMTFVKTPLVVFSDANTMLNPEALLQLVKHYADPRTGGVAGEKKIMTSVGDSAVGKAEGLYWQYESWIKQMDADFYTVVGAAGELFSLRTALFEPLPENTLLDDFVQAMRTCEKGYRMAYEPAAFASELPSASLQQEQKRKIRIAAGAYQAVVLLKRSLNIFRNPRLTFQYVSRRLLRWLICPPALAIVLITNILLVIRENSALYISLLILQGLFYTAAFIGWLVARKGKAAGLFTIAFYFLFMNHCLVRGAFRFISGRQPVLWEKSIREFR